MHQHTRGLVPTVFGIVALVIVSPVAQTSQPAPFPTVAAVRRSGADPGGTESPASDTLTGWPALRRNHSGPCASPSAAVPDSLRSLGPHKLKPRRPSQRSSPSDPRRRPNGSRAGPSAANGSRASHSGSSDAEGRRPDVSPSTRSAQPGEEGRLQEPIHDAGFNVKVDVQVTDRLESKVLSQETFSAVVQPASMARISRVTSCAIRPRAARWS